MLSVVSNKNTITNLKRKVFCQAAWIVNISLVFFFWSLILAVSISWLDNDLCGKLLWYPYWKIIWAGETPVAEWEYHGNSPTMKIKFPFHLDFETDHCFTQWLHNHLGRCPVGVLTFLKIGIQSMQGWTATTRHVVTRKRSTKRLKQTGNWFRKNPQLKGIC